MNSPKPQAEPTADAPVSERIRYRLVSAGCRHHANDNIADFIEDGELEQLTTDHSQVEQYVQQGLLSREDAQFHPDNNLITRAVGATSALFLDCDVAAMQPGDRFLLSSDGLDKHVINGEIADGLRRFELPRCARHLINLALEAGGTDNVSVCLIEVLDD